MVLIFNTSMDRFAIFLIMFMASLGLSMGVNNKSTNVFNIMDFGANGDGENDDSQAFLKSWEEMCESSEDNEANLVIPEGTFLFNPSQFSGPCKPKTINFEIQGHIVAPETTTENLETWIKFHSVDGLHINGNGKGKIDGQGSVWWEKYEDASQRPTALHFSACNDLTLEGLTHVNSQKNHISVNNCNGVIFSNLHIEAPEDSPNTDGIDISESTHVNIHDSFIGTGDDCIAINRGCSDISITKVDCGPGHGISIGSLGKEQSHETVEEVRVESCTFTGTQNGARIKTWQGGSGYARNIHFDDIILNNVGNPIVINQYYCPHSECQNQTSAVEISDVTFTNVRGTSKDNMAINLSCSESVACTNIEVNGVKIESSNPDEQTQAYCLNVYGKYEDTVPSLDQCFTN